MSTTLAALASTVTGPGVRVLGEDAIPIADLAYDSRAVEPGTLFFCVPGAMADGHDYAAGAVASGAAALVTERVLDVEVPQLIVPSARAAMPPIAAEFFGHPSRAMTLVGVTGTNGKTTATFMLESVFRTLGLTPGLTGTVETHIDRDVLPVSRTTPEAIDLQRLLGLMRRSGVGGAAMEVSSDGLAAGRVDCVRFACAIFTNLTQDHLNTHGTMEAYFEAKALLFDARFTDRTVVNADDAYGRRLIDRAALPVTTFGYGEGADVRAVELELRPAGSDVVVDAAGARIPIRVPLPARYNVSNALAVVAAGVSLGWPLDAVASGIAAMRGVPGRVERIDAGQDFTVLVDYAHTPDALEGVLRAAREITPPGARLVAVFGCGGDRDRGKRPLMGAVAAGIADRVIVTSDNPRSEEPGSIIRQITDGIDGAHDAIVDRREAITAAISGAQPGDVIVIAGKGHETGQEFADRTVPFDDRVVAREALGGPA